MTDQNNEQVILNGGDLEELVTSFRSKVEISDRKYGFPSTLYRNCFVGNEAVQVLIDEGMAADVEDAVRLGNIMLEGGARFRVEELETWLDAGLPEAVFETNRYLLENGYDNSAEAALREDIHVIPPVFIHESAQVESSVVGPYASIGANCVVKDAVLRDCIVDEETHISGMVLENSLVGARARLEGKPRSINLGDDTQAML